MSKSRARLLAELLNTEGRVKKDRSDLAGADSVIDLDNLPTITNAKLENSSVTIAGEALSLGGTLSLNTGHITEHTDYKYYTDTRARASISVSGDTLSYNSTTGVITSTANNYSLPTATSSALGGVKIGYTENGKNYPVELSEGQMYVNVPWVDTNTTYSVGDGGLTQNNFTNALKTKLDGIAESANNYTLSTATASALGGVKIGYTENGKNYPVELSEGQMYVNVPWTDTDTNTTYSTATSSVLGLVKIGYTENGKNYPVELSNGQMYVNVPWTDTDTDTTYSVGDGGLTQKNFTTALKTKLDNIAENANNYTLPFTDNSSNWNTAYSWGDHSTEGYATETYVGTQISNLVDSAPATLDTLNELAAALGDDANFSTTVTNSIATKLPLAGGTLTGKLSMFENNEIFGLSGTIADYPRLTFYSSEGTHASKTQTLTGDVVGQLDFSPYTGSSYTGGGKIVFLATESIISTQRGTEARIYSTKTGQAAQSYHQFKDDELYIKNVGGSTYKYWHAGNDGASSGLDADKLDGQQGSYYQAASTALTTSTTFGGDVSGTYNAIVVANDSHSHTLLGKKSDYSWSASTNGRDFDTGLAVSFVRSSDGYPEYGSVIRIHTYPNDGASAEMYFPYSNTYGGNALRYRLGQYNNAGWTGWHTVWSSLNDGSGSGLDADLLDGQHGSYYQAASSALTTSTTFGGDVSGTYNAIVVANDSHNHTKLSGFANQTEYDLIRAGNTNGLYFKARWDGATVNRYWDMGYVDGYGTFYTGLKVTNGGALYYQNNTVWHAGNDGSGSGLDADLLDGLHASSFMRNDAESTTSNSIIIAEDWGSGTYNSAFVIQGSYPSWETRGTSSQDAGWLHHQDSSGNYTLYSIASYTGNSWTQRYTFKPNGQFMNGGPSGNMYWHAGNDGSGSGLDADLLDGQHGSYYAAASHNHSLTLNGDVSGSGTVSGTITVTVNDDSHYHTRIKNHDNRTISPSEYTAGYLNFGFTSWANNNTSPYADFLHFRGYTDSSGGNENLLMLSKSSKNMRLWQQSYGSTTAYASYVDFWHTGNDGSGSGLDADLLDGQHGSYYAPATGGSYVAKSGDSMSGELNITYNTGVTGTSAPSYSNGQIEVQTSSNHVPAIGFHRGGYSATTLYEYDGELYVNAWTTRSQTGKLVSFGNDGSGSGLDADLLDGQHGSYYLNAANFTGTAPTGSPFLSNFVHLGTATAAGYATDDGNWGSRLNVSSTVHAKIEVSQEANSMRSHWYAHTGQDSIKFGTSTSHDVELQRAGSTSLELESGGVKFYVPIRRSNHHSTGFLEGSYNNVGENSYKSNPIYTIGSNYNPADATLSNMYGIGYTHTNASFISMTGASGWGMYVAADGDARIYLGGSNGVISSTGQHYVGSSVVWNAGNDGAGSGLDADLLDGQQGSYYYPASNPSGYTTNTGNVTEGGTSFSGEYPVVVRTSTNTIYSSTGIKFRGSDNRLTVDGNLVWHAGNDGSSSGLDADLLDGKHLSTIWPVHSGSDFTSGTLVTTDIPANTTNGASYIIEVTGKSYSSSPPFSFIAQGYLYNDTIINHSGINLSGYGPSEIKVFNDSNGKLAFWWARISYWNSFSVHVRDAGGSSDNRVQSITNSTEPSSSKKVTTTFTKVWHSGNDGSGSGLDADSLKGYVPQESAVANSIVKREGSGHIYGNYILGSYFNASSGNSENPTIGQIWTQSTSDNYLRKSTPAHLISQLGLWTSSNDGPGSGLAADTVDGLHASSFLRSDADDIKTGQFNQTSGDFISHGSYISHLTTAWQIPGTGKDRGLLPFRFQDGATGQPESGNNAHWGLNIYAHSGSGGSYAYGHQLSGGSTGNLWQRWFSNGVPGGWREVWDSGNDGSGSGLDADLLDGMNASSSVAANTIVARQANGYIYANHINFSTSESENPAINSFFTSNGDGWSRKSTVDHVRSYITGSNTWNNLSTSTGNGANLDSTFTSAAKSGFFDCWSGSNFPPGTSHVQGVQVRHSTGSHYGWQLASQYSQPGKIYLRNVSNSTFYDWATIWTNVNDGSGSGLDADLVDGIHGSSFLRSDADDSFSGQLTMSTQKALIASNYGHGVYGVYSASKYQHVWSMGTSYNAPADGASTGTVGNLYGLAWTYNPNYGGTGNNAQAISGLNHQLLLCMNGTTRTALGSGIWTEGNVTAYSDRRVKTNIELIPNAVEKVQQLNGYTFDRTDIETDPATGETPYVRQTGVIAQEVLEVLPEAVIGSEERGYSVAYGNMVGLLIEAIKELKQEVDDLKAQLKEK